MRSGAEIGLGGPLQESSRDERLMAPVTTTKLVGLCSERTIARGVSWETAVVVAGTAAATAP